MEISTKDYCFKNVLPLWKYKLIECLLNWIILLIPIFHLNWTTCLSPDFMRTYCYVTWLHNLFASGLCSLYTQHVKQLWRTCKTQTPYWPRAEAGLLVTGDHLCGINYFGSHAPWPTQTHPTGAWLPGYWIGVSEKQLITSWSWHPYPILQRRCRHFFDCHVNTVSPMPAITLIGQALLHWTMWIPN